MSSFFFLISNLSERDQSLGFLPLLNFFQRLYFQNSILFNLLISKGFRNIWIWITAVAHGCNFLKKTFSSIVLYNLDIPICKIAIHPCNSCETHACSLANEFFHLVRHLPGIWYIFPKATILHPPEFVIKPMRIYVSCNILSISFVRSNVRSRKRKI